MKEIQHHIDENENIKRVLEYVTACQQFSPSDVDYHFFTDAIKELSGAAIVGLNLVSEQDQNKTAIKAISRAPGVLTRIMKATGLNPEGTEWDVKRLAMKTRERNKLLFFPSFKDIGYENAAPRVVAMFNIVEKVLQPNGLYIIEFDHQGDFLGIIFLIMPKNKTLEKKDLIELFINQIVGTIKRLQAENNLQKNVTALRESEASFKAYMEQSPHGIFIVDQQGRYTGVNREACRMSGYTEAELLTLSLPDFLAPEFLEKGIKIFERLQSEDRADEDIMARKKNGNTFWINLAAVKINHQTVAFCQDITERKESEERAKELNCLHSFSRLLQKEQNDLEKIMDETVGLLTRSFRYPANAVASITFKDREFKSQNHKPTPWKITSTLALNGKQTGAIEVGYLEHPLHEQEAFTKEETLMLGTIAEHLSRVTEQTQAEEDLRKSKNQLSTTLSSIGDGVIVTDISGNITRLNPQAEKLTGWTSEEALGQAVYKVLHIVNTKTGELTPNPVYNVINSGRAHSLAENSVLINRAGEKCHIADSAAPIRDDDGIMQGVVMVFSDVTQRKNAEESLKHQFHFQKMLADISSIFATQPSDQLEQSITYVLAQVGEFFQVERSYVFQFSEDGKKMSNTFEWCAEGQKTQINRLSDVPIDMFPWWTKEIKNKKYVAIPDVGDLPQEAQAEKKFLMSQDTRSLLSIPMMNKGIVFGFLGIDTVKEKRDWTDNQVMSLTLVAELASNAYSRNKAEEKVRYNSLHDGLTGLYNRFFLENEMKRLDTQRQLPIGIMMIDLNGFKIVNDTLGHDVGDDMLRQSAKIFRISCRSEDLIARWGGDEFVIFLPQTTEKEARAIRQRIDENCKKHAVNDIIISMAIGYAIKDTADQDLIEVLKEAEIHMYKHKMAENPQARK